MSIKGFMGFWGSCKENLISQSLCDKYKSAIYNGVFFCEERYTVIVSGDYLFSQEEKNLKIKSGSDCLEDFGNLIATVTIDADSLCIERDRWGTRMVYYICVGQSLYFASDIRFLLELPLTNIKEYNQDALVECATMGFVYEDDNTLFHNIKQLPRNSKLEFVVGNLKIKRNIISVDKNRFECIEDALSAFEEAFEGVVAGANKVSGRKAYLLSGGMDSSALSVAAAKSDKIETISFSSVNNTEDVYYAKELAKYISSNHTILEFSDDKAITELPIFLNDIESVEMDGIFSPLGGYAYYLLCKELRALGFDVVFPGEGADEILGGYYWQLTHTFGFVDKLKEKTKNTQVYDKVVKLFPEVEERHLYREIAYYLLQGSALTNYHLNCVEHTAKACGLYNYPIYMTAQLYDVVKDIPMRWLCDGKDTKIILRKYLLKHLDPIGLSGLVTRKKLAMPSVIPNSFSEGLMIMARKESKHSDSPFMNILGNKPLNVFMLDVFHKYYTSQPMKPVNVEEWREDLARIENDECIIHW